MTVLTFRYFLDFPEDWMAQRWVFTTF